MITCKISVGQSITFQEVPVPLSAPATWMEILTEETFFILTQPRCFSACDIFFLAVVRTVEEEAGSSEKLLGSTLILGNPSQ